MGDDNVVIGAPALPAAVAKGLYLSMQDVPGVREFHGRDALPADDRVEASLQTIAGDSPKTRTASEKDLPLCRNLLESRKMLSHP